MKNGNEISLKMKDCGFEIINLFVVNIHRVPIDAYFCFAN